MFKIEREVSLDTIVRAINQVGAAVTHFWGTSWEMLAQSLETVSKTSNTCMNNVFFYKK